MVTIVVSVAAYQLKVGGCFNAIEIYRQCSGKRAKRDALGIKTSRDLLHDIGMSFVHERVHLGCHMIPG